VQAWAANVKSAQNMPDAQAEAYITSTLMPGLSHIQAEIGQLKDEATVPSDLTRIASVQQGIGTMYSGLEPLGQGHEADGDQEVEQAVGQIIAAQALTGIAICGSQPNSN
jgi:hypothetical protein